MAIDFDVDGRVAVITINRPERLNAMDAEHYDLLSKAWSRVRDDRDIYAVVVTGAGDRAFTVGADLKSFVTAPPDMADFMMTQKGQLLNRGLEVWKPVICAIKGLCLGGGMTLMLATDIRVAAESATFGLTEVKRGLFPANGGTQRILKQMPYSIGMEMLLSGDNISAQEAARWGLVNRVVAAEQVIPVAMEIAQRIACNAPLATQAAKELAARSLDLKLTDGLRLEQAMLRLLQDTTDAAEGAKAFFEKREPNYTAT